MSRLMLRHVLRPFAFLAVLVATVAVALPASAVPSDPASQFISNLGNQAIGILSNKSLSTTDRSQQFENIFVTNFDVPAIGKFVLGRYARTATPDQMSTYQGLFKDYVVGTYATRLSSYTGQTLDVVGATPIDNGRTSVKSQINQPGSGQPPIQVDWILTGQGSDYRIVDVVIGGVSMALSQRSEFGSVIQNGGGTIDALIQKLRDQLASIQANQ
jgi:phospholipid transport system substrate-binding protein